MASACRRMRWMSAAPCCASMATCPRPPRCSCSRGCWWRRAAASAAARSPSAPASRPRPCASGWRDMLRGRSTADEWMDDAAATEPAFAGALRDLARVNRLSLAYRPTLRWLDRLVARTGARRLSVLDVGAGGGDMLLQVEAWARRRGVEVALTGLDRSPWSATYAAAAGVPADWIIC